MNFHIHVALDAFGAEALGRASTWLRRIADPAREHHLYVWAGVGEPPVNTDYWAERYPVWDDHIDAPASATQGIETDRQLLAASVYKSLLSDEGIQKISALTHDWPNRRLGRNHAAQPLFVYCVSLLDPAGSSLLLGHLAALADRRKVGALPYRAHVIAGVGLSSGAVTGREEETRALGAQALTDLEVLFKGRPLADVATPIYLVGEQAIDGAESDRAAQTALAAMGTVAVARGPDGRNVNAFEFALDGAGQPQWAGAPYTADQPFSAIGGYAIWCPVDRLARLFSARLAATCFEMLAKQENLGSLERAGKVDDLPPGISGLLDGIENETVRRVWERVVEPEHIPWDPRTTPPPSGCFDLERVRALYGTIFDEKEWQRTMRVYGEPRLRETPIDAWENEFDELEEIIEHGVLPRRRQRVDLITRRILQSFLNSVEFGVSEIFGHSLLDPVRMLPHRCTQVYLGSLRRSLLAKGEGMEREVAHDRATQEDPATLRKSVTELRNQLRQAIESVPSPLAVFLRGAPLLVLVEALFFVLPFNLGRLNPPAMRLASGAIAGALATLLLFIRQVENVRSHLLEGVARWRKQYQAALDLEDEILRDKSYRDLLDSMVGCLDWLFNGKEDEPPLPRIIEPKVKASQAKDAIATPGDILTPQEPLSRFRAYLEAAAARYRGLEKRFLEDFQSSRLETALPEISVLNADVLQSEFASFLGVAPEADIVAAAIEMASQIRQWLAEGAEQNWTMPFATSPAALIPPWRRSFLTPTGQELLKSEVRSESSGFQFLATVQRNIESRFAGCFDLSERVDDYTSRQGQTLALTDLFRRYTACATPSLPVDGAVLSHVSGAGISDSLAANLRCQNALGGCCLSMYLQVSQHISAKQAISYPNEQEPLTPMGKAWKMHKGAPFTGAALKPITEFSQGASA